MNIPSYSSVHMGFKSNVGSINPWGSLQGSISKMQMTDSSQPAKSFQQVMMDTVKGVNDVVEKPNTLLREAMTTGGVDIHDVMIANSKAELAVSLTSQFATKIIQAYDRILQIQV